MVGVGTGVAVRGREREDKVDALFGCNRQAQ